MNVNKNTEKFIEIPCHLTSSSNDILDCVAETMVVSRHRKKRLNIKQDARGYADIEYTQISNIPFYFYLFVGFIANLNFKWALMAAFFSFFFFFCFIPIQDVISPNRSDERYNMGIPVEEYIMHFHQYIAWNIEFKWI